MRRRFLACIFLCTSLQQVVSSLAIEKKSQSTSNEIPPQVIVAASKTAVSEQRQLTGTEEQQKGVQPEDNRRPIWNLAHMVNSIKELDYRLGKGANGVEIDVTFGRDGDPLYTYHGPPCDCLRHCHQQENIHEYLSYVREIAIDKVDGLGQNLTLLFLDLKLDSLNLKGKAKAGQELAKSIGLNLFLDSDIMRKAIMTHEPLARNDSSLIDDLIPTPKRMIRLILSVNHVTDIELIFNFIHFMEENNATHLMDRIGFDVGMNDDLNQIDSMWQPLRNRLNLWQGDGYTNCLSPFYNLGRLSKAIQRRDDVQGYPAKVYHWTIDIHDRMRDSLRMGVDAIMTNHPERLVTVLREPEMAQNFRLANLNDNPFKKISSNLVSRINTNELGRHQRSAQTSPSPRVGVAGGFLGGLFDIISSLYAYVREIPFLSLPTTSRFMPKTIREFRMTGTSQPLPPPKPTQSDENLQARVVNQAVNSSSSPSDSPMVASSNSPSIDDNNRKISVSESVDKVSVEPANNSAAIVAAEYRGPRWYTSLISNMIVSFMEIILPAPTSQK